VKFLSAPVPITAGVNAGAYAVYLRDPDGFTIELVQPAPGKVQTDQRQLPDGFLAGTK
jgi:hypothetical protein